MVHLLFDGRERGRPRYVPVAHFGQLIVAQKKAVLDGIYAALDGPLKTVVTRAMRDGLPVVAFGGGDNRADLFGCHLRRGCDCSLLEVDNAGGNELDAIGPGPDARCHACSGGWKALERIGHEAAVTPPAMDRRARAVDVGHERPIGRGAKPAQRQAHAISIAAVAHGRHAEAHDLFEAPPGQLKQLFGRLLQKCCALVEIELAALKKNVRVRVDESGEQSVVGQFGVWRSCRAAALHHFRGRRISAGIENPSFAVDNVCIALRCCA